MSTIRLENITKAYNNGNIIANDNISIEIKSGEIHSILGENGAGKSTLISIIMGLVDQDSGYMFLNDQEIRKHNPQIANQLGIGLVPQHAELIHDKTVWQNVILGVEPTKLGFVKKTEARERVLKTINHYKMDINVDALCENLTVGQRQKVQILNALYLETDIIIFDEPTSMLAPQEIEQLLEAMLSLKKEGKTIIFISHKLKEVLKVSDRLTVLRRGKFVKTLNRNEATEEILTDLMIGHGVQLVTKEKKAFRTKPNLVVANLNKHKHKLQLLNDISFVVNEGEILGIASIEGNGERELFRVLMGTSRFQNGRIELKGEDISHWSIAQKADHAFANISEDRHIYGLVLDLPVYENAVLSNIAHASPNIKFKKNNKFLALKSIANGITAQLVSKRKMKEFTREVVNKFDVRGCENLNIKTRALSGGNQQKLIVGRELSKDSKVLLAAHPTRGVDVRAIQTIYDNIIDYRNKGKSVLLLSSELDELIAVSDRILVLHKGHVAGVVDPKHTTKYEIGKLMLGVK